MRALLIVVFALAWVIRGFSASVPADIEGDRDVQILLKTEYFGFGPLGLSAGAKITEGEAAMRRLLKKPEAIRYFFPVFDRGTFAEKCHALVVFRALAPEYFESSRRRLTPMLESKVRTVSGCILGEQKLGDLVQRIAEEAYTNEVLPKTG